jgi:hypothetical protein
MTRAGEMLWAVTLTWIVACLPRSTRAENPIAEDTSDQPDAGLTRGPGESLEDFVERNGPPGATLETLKTGEGRWGGAGAVVAFYRLGSDDEQQGSELEHVSAYVFLPKTNRSQYDRGLVGTCEWEGGPPTVKAAFFAAAGPLHRTKLFVICAWHVQHYDVSGTLYATNVYDAPARDTSGGVVVKGGENNALSGGCDCAWRNGRTRKARHTTERAVRAALRTQR